MTRKLLAATLAVLCLANTGEGATPSPVGVTVQADAHLPQPWRKLTAEEQAKFDLGHAAFNTSWSPANKPAGRTDGLGPLFNVQSCDACHNSRRRGRGPRADGDAPVDLVIQLGRVLPNGSVERGLAEYGHILNTAATEGFSPEATVTIRYEELPRYLIDNTRITLRKPTYVISNLTGKPLPENAVIMPRMPPLVQGAGLLARVPESALVSRTKAEANPRIPRGRVSRLNGGTEIGRFGWQATEATVASQTASAFSREMGLTSDLAAHIDCGDADQTCLDAPSGGTPEVERSLFDALVWFQDMHSVPVAKAVNTKTPGAQLFTTLGCAGCHRPTLPVQTDDRRTRTIAAYTDLLLHDLGEDLADRDVSGRPVRSEWRTAPLWGIGASVATGQPLRLLHDGRARSIKEAILWHGGAATDALHQYLTLSAAERDALEAWVAQL